MKFTWVYVLCLAVIRVSAQSFHTGFALTGFSNLRERRDANFGVQTPIIETSQIPISNFLTPTMAQGFVRPQIRKEMITIPSVQRFSQASTSPVIQTTPFVGAKNFQIQAFPLHPQKMFTEASPTSTVDGICRIFPGNAVNVGSSIPRLVDGLNGNFQGVFRGAFLGNPVADSVSSFPGNVGAGFRERANGALLSGSPIMPGGFTNEELCNSC